MGAAVVASHASPVFAISVQKAVLRQPGVAVWAAVAEAAPGAIGNFWGAAGVGIIGPEKLRQPGVAARAVAVVAVPLAAGNFWGAAGVGIAGSGIGLSAFISRVG